MCKTAVCSSTFYLLVEKNFKKGGGGSCIYFRLLLLLLTGQLLFAILSQTAPFWSNDQKDGLSSWLIQSWLLRWRPWTGRRSVIGHILWQITMRIPTKASWCADHFNQACWTRATSKTGCVGAMTVSFHPYQFLYSQISQGLDFNYVAMQAAHYLRSCQHWEMSPRHAACCEIKPIFVFDCWHTSGSDRWATLGYFLSYHM